MSQLIVRDIDEDVVKALRCRAAEHGRSAEAEHREILKNALLRSRPQKKSFKEALASMPYFDDDDLFNVR